MKRKTFIEWFKLKWYGKPIECTCGSKLVFGDKSTIHPNCQVHRLRGYHKTLD